MNFASDRRCLAEDAVSSEPFSPASSLFTMENTGNFTDFGLYPRKIGSVRKNYSMVC